MYVYHQLQQYWNLLFYQEATIAHSDLIFRWQKFKCSINKNNRTGDIIALSDSLQSGKVPVRPTN